MKFRKTYRTFALYWRNSMDGIECAGNFATRKEAEDYAESLPPGADPEIYGVDHFELDFLKYRTA